MVVELEGYAYCVPYAVEGDTWHLKTIYPSRKFKHLLKRDTMRRHDPKYIDSEERHLIEEIKKADTTHLKRPSKRLQSQVRSAAKVYIEKESKMNIRIAPSELAQIKAKAQREGLKYQSLVKSVLHKYVTGQLMEKGKKVV